MDVKKLGILFLLFLPIAGAQTKVPPPGTNGAGAGDVRNVPPVESHTADPVLSPENHAKIRDLQREQDKLVITSLQLQKQQEELQKQYGSVLSQIEDAVLKAMIDAKADGKEWTLDREALTFKKIPPPPTPNAPAPTTPPAKKKP